MLIKILLLFIDPREIIVYFQTCHVAKRTFQISTKRSFNVRNRMEVNRRSAIKRVATLFNT